MEQFQVYNTILRRWPKARFDELETGGNIYTTTIYVLMSAIIKIAREVRLPPGLTLFRGLGGDRTFPRSFHVSDAKGRKGVLEWGFMSTTASKEIATKYSGIMEGKPFPTIFEIVPGAVDRGAIITGFSQYPGVPNQPSPHFFLSALNDLQDLRCRRGGVPLSTVLIP